MQRQRLRDLKQKLGNNRLELDSLPRQRRIIPNSSQELSISTQHSHSWISPSVNDEISSFIRDLISLQGNFQQRVRAQNDRLLAQHDDFVKQMLEKLNN